MLYRIVLVGCALFSGAQGFAEFASYQVAEKSYEGYYIAKGKEAPLVVIIHDWDGLNDYEIRRAKMLADLGYSVFALDLFGKGVRPSQDAEKRKLTGELYQNRPLMRAAMEGALKAAEKLGLNTKKVVAAGYCFGGAAVLEWARAGAPLQGFVSFHGGLDVPAGQDYKSVKGQILVMHGSADEAVSLESLAKLGAQLESNRVPHELIAYSGAPHAFTVFDSPRYRADADKKSWSRFIAFLQETLL